MASEPADRTYRRSVNARSDEVFVLHQQDIYRRTDRLFAYLMGFQWIAGVVFALVVSPRAWSGSVSYVHVHVWAALFLGGGISLFPALLAIYRPGLASTRHTIATAQMMMSALLIHLTGGRLETHFHVFGSLAFLAFYRDWRVLVPATLVVALDHLLRGIFWPESVYGVLVASPWRWLEHAAWVAFEDIFLVMACVRGTHELREIADRTATLEEAHKDETRHTIEANELVARLRLSQQHVEAAARAKSEFMANMSHELRTPLNAITLYSELLQEDAVAEGRAAEAEDLSKILTSSRHLLGLINGILDLSKVEAGKMELHLESFDVRRMVEELISTIDALVRKNDNTLTVTFDGPLGTMWADLTKTRQILYNLLSNAAKFTRHGHVTLAVGRRESGGQALLEFAVRDTGIGLAEGESQRLFRPFAQGDSSIGRRYGGTGLGLALVSRFCQLMGGTVEAEGAPGKGACFTVTLPASVPHTSAPPPEPPTNVRVDRDRQEVAVAV